MDNPIHNNMDVSSEAVSEQQRRLIVSVPAAEVSGRIESRLRQIAKTAKLPGFRPGKVPMNHIRREYSYTVHQEVMDQLIRDTLFKAIEQQNVRFVGMPQIESVEDQDDRVVYKALLELYPVVSLKPFGELQIERVTSELQDSDVETMIENLRKQGQTFGDKDGAAASGDRVTIDVRLDGQGKITEIAHQVRGCLLCQASASALAATAVGRDATSVGDLRLDAERALGREPGEAGEPFSAFAPVAAHKSRQECVLLPFEALKDALS